MISLQERVEILVKGAKYDVSCSSSGSTRMGKSGMLGNAAVEGICHSYAGDGRCISLLKILMSNACVYDCEYCPNRRSADVPRASITVDELCSIVVNFYKRNYIEGLFLSSAVERNANYTMEKLTECVIKLRKIYAFNGYIHLKGIPGADLELVMKAAKYVDRMSFNIELPSERSLKLLAPQKKKEDILSPMKSLAKRYIDEGGSRGNYKKSIPAGQTTQLIVGASGETDGQIVRLSGGLYGKYALKRVYYSSYIPVVTSPLLPTKYQGLLREHRLYQADWLMRFYGFSPNELLSPEENFPMDIDPKEFWALKNMGLFPVEVNTAPYEMILRIPGIGVQSAAKIISARRYAKLEIEHLKKMGVVLKRARHFLTANGKFFGFDRSTGLRGLLSIAGRGVSMEQLSIFGNEETKISALIGEV